MLTLLSPNLSLSVEPVVKGLLDPSEVVNGEELEDCLHKVRAKLYRLKMKEWAEVGIGFLKVVTLVASCEWVSPPYCS